MPRIRTLKPEFFRSPDTAAVDFPVRIFYEALWCWADDFGVGETNLYGLLGFAFPDSDGFTVEDVRRFCADIAAHFGASFYMVRGRAFYAIPSWSKHQKNERRQGRRRNPPPDDPEAVPDQQIYACADFAPTNPRKIAANPRKIPLGTGEQGNRGTGTSSGYLGGEGYQSNAPATQNGADPDAAPPPQKNLADDPPSAPPPFCEAHMPDGAPPGADGRPAPCRGCAAARTTRTDWLAEKSAEASEAARLTAQAERRSTNTARLDAVAACPMCDQDGYRITTTGNPGAVCDHIDHQAQTTHGRAQAAQVLAEIRARKANR